MFDVLRNAFNNRSKMVIPSTEIQVGDIYNNRQVVCVRRFEFESSIAMQVQLLGSDQWHAFGNNATVLVDRPNDLTD